MTRIAIWTALLSAIYLTIAGLPRPNGEEHATTYASDQASHGFHVVTEGVSFASAEAPVIRSGHGRFDRPAIAFSRIDRRQLLDVRASGRAGAVGDSQ